MLRNRQLLTENQAIEYDKDKLEERRKEHIVALRNSLLGYQELGNVRYVKILASCDGACCSACMKLNGKRVLLKDELENPTLPVKNCENAFCRCGYV